LALQKREADLVIGTFGRSIYILDDIRPLRQIAATGGEILKSKLAVFEPADGIIVDGMLANSGSHFPADAIFSGESKEIGAFLKILVKPEKKAKSENPLKKEAENMEAHGPEGRSSGGKDSLIVTIFDDAGELIKTIKQVPDTGLNIVRWRFDSGELKMPTRGESRMGRRSGFSSRGSKQALPGNYKVVAEFNDQKDSTSLNVIFDPRIPKPVEVLKAQNDLIDQLTADLEILYNGTERLKESKSITEKISAQLKGLDGDEIKALKKEIKAINDSISAVQDDIFGKEDEDAQGITSRTEITATSMVFTAMRYISSRPGMPTSTEQQLVSQAKELMVKGVNRINAFYETSWPEFRKKVEETEISIFKDYKPLRFD